MFLLPLHPLPNPANTPLPHPADYFVDLLGDLLDDLMTDHTNLQEWVVFLAITAADDLALIRNRIPQDSPVNSIVLGRAVWAVEMLCIIEFGGVFERRIQVCLSLLLFGEGVGGGGGWGCWG